MLMYMLMYMLRMGHYFQVHIGTALLDEPKGDTPQHAPSTSTRDFQKVKHMLLPCIFSLLPVPCQPEFCVMQRLLACRLTKEETSVQKISSASFMGKTPPQQAQANCLSAVPVQFPQLHQQQIRPVES
ncbi:hypothetical protein XENORESO_015772 [Xenotaenia resolanae]|uniref:Uncharacterized protein n=1 Tax=Xenotaenia resolanae TaxID=208358 RepID=A0ABV0W331_9TELE